MADFSSFLEDLQEFDVNDIDFSRVGVWPLPAKILLFVLAAAALVAACYFLVVKDKHVELGGAEQKEVQLKKDFKSKVSDAANLEQYREQMIAMTESYDALVSRLPEKTEVPGLIEDIDDKGVDSRLEINSIDLRKEVSTEIHIELPINISVTGGYHEFGSFISGIAGMPRIVTLHDFKISKKSTDSALLSMDLEAKTYRYKPEGQ